MADRIFASITLLIVLGYGFIAFTSIHAPIQYDSLGPESWPRLLSVLAGLCCLWIIFRPTQEQFELARAGGIKLVLMLVALTLYALLFEPAGFIIATALFCALASRLLGASLRHAAIFGLSTSVIGYLIGAKLLELNLPAGVLSTIL